MSHQQLHEIGKPYFSTKSEGTCLGLMVTLRLIESMQGSLTFDSELGKGTTACITIKGTSKP